MSFESNLRLAIAEAAAYKGTKGKQVSKRLGITLCLPQYVEKYNEEEDTLTCVSHYYKECPQLQGVFFYRDNQFKGHKVRRYQSTRNLKTLQETLAAITTPAPRA